MVRLALESLPGWSVTACASGSEALAEVSSAPYDLMLLDVMMPDMDGPETLRRLRREGYGSLPVVFLTARSRQAEVRKYEEMGVLGVISKPFDPLELPSIVRGMWLQRHHENRESKDPYHDLT
jgi:CheY-like chemotaxis protein